MDNLVPFFREAAAPDLKVLEFGIESENGDSIPDEELYDAVNDETFGGDIASIAANEDDLEEFSTRTGNLSLFDESCSIQLPDPSQIPIPRLFADNEQEKNQSEKNGASQSMSSIWGTGSFNGIHSLSKNYTGTIGMECQSVTQEEQRNQLQQVLRAGFSSINQQFVGEMPAHRSADANCQSLTRNAIERPQAVLPNMPVPSSNNGKTLSLEELERRMLLEVSAMKGEKEQHVSPVSTEQSCLPTTGPFFPPFGQQKSILGGISPFDASLLRLPPPQQLMQLNHLMQGYQIALASAAASGLPPPPFPPLPFFPNQLSMAPPIPALTPKTTMPQRTEEGRASVASCFTSQVSLPRTPVSFPMQSANATFLNQCPHPSTPPSMPHLTMVPSSLHPRTERHQRLRMNGLPSEKTICDFALDPYAGFMSTKEREWLIKIHIIQCLGSGDPIEDDYYYTMWKKRNVLQKAPEQWKSRENPKYYKFEATFPSTAYTAPSFLGSLGKPIHSTTSQPRQIIEVNSDNSEDGSVKNRQKRLRAMLMKIENGALALLDCRTIRRKLRFFEETCITQFLDQNEITDRTARFADNLAHVDLSLFSTESLPTVMLIQKGRVITYDWLNFWMEEKDFENALSHTRRIFLSMPKFARKMPEVALKQFSDSVCLHFAGFPLESLGELLQHTGKWELTLISESKLVQLTLLSLTLAFIDRSEHNVRLSELRNTGAAQFLLMPASSLKLVPENDADLFKHTQWAQLRQWLIREQVGGGVSLSSSNVPTTSLIQWIIENQTFVLI
ncbi:hypothetical protein niasHT_007343 [Heterodera trifolii]|uniref:Uncharacterized protein n=1 Tax=Heterodera trifolii TaxID=157864 RepID=A0ABD2LLD3_9BILA